MLTLAQDDGRRIWVILDELPTLHQVPSSSRALPSPASSAAASCSASRSPPRCATSTGATVPRPSPGSAAPGWCWRRPTATRRSGRPTASGRSEIEEVSEGFSYGANTIRDGVSLTPRRELRALALPSEIMRLENLSGYLKFPGPFPVASIRLKYVSRPKAAERFVARGGDGAEPRSGAEEADGSSVSIPEPARTRTCSNPPTIPAWPPRRPSRRRGRASSISCRCRERPARPEPDAATAETADTEARDKAPDGGRTAGSEGTGEPGRAPTPAGGGRGSDWG